MKHSEHKRFRIWHFNPIVGNLFGVSLTCKGGQFDPPLRKILTNTHIEMKFRTIVDSNVVLEYK